MLIAECSQDAFRSECLHRHQQTRLPSASDVKGSEAGLVVTLDTRSKSLAAKRAVLLISLDLGHPVVPAYQLPAALW
jgi:hypothetical protein